MHLHPPLRAAAALALTALLAAAAPSPAEPLNPQSITPDARWYIHVDVARLVASPIGVELREHWQQMPDSRQKMAQLRLITGMDPWTDLKGLTLFGPSGDQEEAVAIIHATADPKVIENAVALAQDYSVVNHAGRQVHMWTPDDGKHDTMALCVFSPTTYVIGVSPDRVKTTIDNLANTKAVASPLIEKAPADRWMEMAVVDINGLPKMQDRQPWMSRLRDLRISVGSDQDNAMMTVTGIMADAQTATQVRAMLDGFKAMALLNAEQNDPNVVPFLNKLNVQNEGDRLWIDFAAPVDDLVEMIKVQAQKHRGGDEEASSGKKPSLQAPLGHMLDL